MKTSVKEALTLQYMSGEESGWEDGEKVFIVQERAWELNKSAEELLCIALETSQQ